MRLCVCECECGFLEVQRNEQKKSSHVFLQETMFPRKSPLWWPIHTGVGSELQKPTSPFVLMSHTHKEKKSIEISPEEDAGKGGRKG